MDRVVQAIYGGGRAPWHFSFTGPEGRAVLRETPLTPDEALGPLGVGAAHTERRQLVFADDGSDSGMVGFVSKSGHLLSVKPKDAPLIQYSDAFREAMDLLDTFGAQIMAAGVLADGGIAWLSAELPDPYVIRHRDGRTDHHLPYLTLQDSHDATIAKSVYLASLRIECWNMLMAAQSEERATGKRVRSRGTNEKLLKRWREALASMGDFIATERAQRVVIQRLAETPFAITNFGDFATKLLLKAESRPKAERDAMAAMFDSGYAERAEMIRKIQNAQNDPDQEHARTMLLTDGIGTEMPISRRTANLFATRYERLNKLFVEGTGNKGADKYDALNAVTEWVDHEGVRNHRGDPETAGQSRFASSLRGEGASLKSLAFEMLSAEE